MKKKTHLFILTILIVFSHTLVADLTAVVEAKTVINPTYASATSSKSEGAKKKYDATTSASKLRAKRSHSVSKEDETGLAIFFGLFILCIIIFFLKPFNEKK